MSVKEPLQKAIQEGKISKAIKLAKAWLAEAKPGDPEALLASCELDVQPHIALLLRDIMARYPATVVGAPVQVHWTPEKGLTSLRLPYPPITGAQPCQNLHFLGWVEANTQAPIAFPFQPQLHAIRIPGNEIVSLVALFKTSPAIFELDEVELPDPWWGNLFRDCPGSIRLSSRMLTPYPDALEAARCMQSVVNGSLTPTCYFLPNVTRDFALGAGALFLETCSRSHPAA